MRVTHFTQALRIVPSAFRHFVKTVVRLCKVSYRSSHSPLLTFRACWEFRFFENGRAAFTCVIWRWALQLWPSAS